MSSDGKAAQQRLALPDELPTGSGSTAIRVTGLSKCYQIYETPHDRLMQFVAPRLPLLFGRRRQYFREFWALRDISFEIGRGETVGIVGRNGSGKSTLLQIICGTLHPSGGEIETFGRVAALLELGSGFNPEFTGRENVYLNASVLGLTKEEIDARFDEIARFADIGGFIEQPIKNYSSGMVVRLAFAVIISVNPQILVVDEALAVGDAAFQRKCIRRIQDMVDSGVTLLFVSHDAETVRKLCSRAVYLKNGQLQMLGDAKSVCLAYEMDLFGSGEADAGRGEAMATHPGAADANGVEMVEEGHENDAEPGLNDPTLFSTCEKSYGDGRARIDGLTIRSLSGSQINVLALEQEFRISYRVTFLQVAEAPVFGMMFNDREGICVFGTNTSGMGVSQQSYQPGDCVNVAFTLKNHLCPGIFYLTCGVHASDVGQGLVYLDRKIDTMLIRSFSPGTESIGGLAFLRPTIQAEKIAFESLATSP